MYARNEACSREMLSRDGCKHVRAIPVFVVYIPVGVRLLNYPFVCASDSRHPSWLPREDGEDRMFRVV